MILSVQLFCKVLREVEWGTLLLPFCFQTLSLCLSVSQQNACHLYHKTHRYDARAIMHSDIYKEEA